MVDDQSAVVAERGEDPGVCTAPHSTVHRVLMLLKCADHLVTLGGRGAGEREGGHTTPCKIWLTQSWPADPHLSSSPSSMPMSLRGSEAMEGSWDRTTWLSELAVRTSWSWNRLYWTDQILG